MAYIEDTAVGPECRPVPEQEMRCPATRPPPLWRAAHGVALLATFATAEREEMTGIRRPLPPSYTMQGMDMDVAEGGCGGLEVEAFFYFYIFQNCFLHKYIFSFIIYRFIPLPPGCGTAGPFRPPAGR